MKVAETSEIVYPGKTICVIEEYFPGFGTSAENQGYIKATLIGKIKRDKKTREILIEPTKDVRIPKLKDDILGIVTSMAGIFANVKILQINGELINPTTGVLYPFRGIGRGVVQYKPSDIVLAYVESKKNRTIHLSMDGKKFGIVRAMCNSCGSQMIKIQSGPRTILKCSVCGRVDERKISSLYGFLSQGEF